jgi:hypothetical protein
LGCGAANIPSQYERPSPVSVKMVLNIQETKGMNIKEHQGVEYIRNIGKWEKNHNT